MSGADLNGDEHASAGADPAPACPETASEAAKRLYAYWLARRGKKRFPAREDIDPLDFKFALGRVSLIEVLENPQRFRYRLVSTSITRHLGYEMTGKFTSEVPERELRDYVERLYAKAVSLAAPFYQKETAVYDGRVWEYEALMLPLSSDGQKINMILAYREAAPPRPAPAPPRSTGDR
jgi:hypothetical protein